MKRPSSLAVLWLFARTALRRFSNRSQNMKFGKQNQDAAVEGPRTATLNRGLQTSRLGRMIAKVLPTMMVFGGILICSAFIMSVVDLYRLQEMRAATKLPLWPEQFKSLTAAAQIENTEQRQAAADDVFKQLLGTETGLIGSQSLTLAKQRFADAGLAGFQAVEPQQPWRGELAVLSPESRTQALKSIGLFMLLLGVAATGMALGLMNGNLGNNDSSLGWLFQFPVSRSTLFLSKLIEYTLDTPMLVFVAALNGIFLYLVGSPFWLALAVSLAFGVTVAVTSAALRLSTEIVLLQKINRKTRALVVATSFTVGNMAGIFVLAAANSLTLLQSFTNVAGRMPDYAFLNPFSLGFGSSLIDRGMGSGWWLIAPVMAVGLSMAAIALAVNLTRYGLLTASESGRSDRPVKSSLLDRATRFSGVVRKELLQLTRQPEYLGNTVGAMLGLMVMLYMLLPSWSINLATQDVSAVCVSVFVASVYVIFAAGQRSLASEMKTLWLLQCQPRSLAESIRSKSRVWGVVSVIMASALLIAVMIRRPSEAGDVLMRLPFILIAIWMLSEVLFGMLALSATLMSERTVTFRRSAMLLPLLTTSGVSTAIATADLWQQVVMFVMLLVLRAAVWQQQQFELAWLSEPVEVPPKRLSAIHGIGAYFGFSTLQGLFTGVLKKLDVDESLQFSGAYVGAALIVGLISWRWMRSHQFRLFQTAPTAPVARPLAIAIGATCSVALILVGALRHFLPERGGSLVFAGTPSAPNALGSWLAITAVVVLLAPLFEEWIFRGLLFQSLRRSYSAWSSIVLSAIFFAAIHPLLSLPGVLTLGLANAWIVERTGRLWPAIVVHIIYNATVVALWNVPLSA